MLVGTENLVDLSVSEGLDFFNYVFDFTGAPYRLSAYMHVEVIDHIGLMSV